MVTAFVRTILLYFIIMLGLRLMGKRQIGELEPTELVLTMLISDLAAVPMQDFGIPLLNGVVPIVTLLALSMLLSYGCMRSIRLRRLVCGSPTTLIKDGILQQAAMRANRFTLDELIEALRSQGVTDLTTVKYAILETDGQLSVLLYPAEQPATPKQLGRAVKDDLSLPQVLINDGRILWYNQHFKEQVLGDYDAVTRPVARVLPEFDLAVCSRPHGQDLTVGERRFTAYSATAKGSRGASLVYLIDDTFYKETLDEYNASRPACLIIVIDSYDELFDDMKDSEQAKELEAINSLLEEYIGRSSGFLRM